ncbi:MAG: 2Fe-2S iron-sulfur cluster binding domain-containing protein, partial [Firmicutes bacterium]|nr:2Fe-2S iron-sulfur cluster binding domain-containing protein [Bacillota bacterium]
MLNVTIDGKTVQVKEGTTILEACEFLDVEIPTLCHLKHLAPEGSCRMCVVEVKGARDLKVSCATECTDGMEVITMNEKVYAWRRFIVEMLLADHDISCFSCSDTGQCKLYQYALDYGISEPRFKV